MSKKKLSKTQTAYLKRLNYLLKYKENELLVRCIKLFEAYEKRLKSHWGDLDDYEIELIIRYNKYGYPPKYIYREHLRKSMFNGEAQRLLATEKDWWQTPLPKLGEPWCYLLHNLYEHTRKDDFIFEITDFNVEILISEQQQVTTVGLFLHEV